jgi:hypothetical protein
MTIEDACAMVRETFKAGFYGSLTLHGKGDSKVALVEMKQTFVEKPKAANTAA